MDEEKLIKGPVNMQETDMLTHLSNVQALLGTVQLSHRNPPDIEGKRKFP
jgi:hypothetical protein